MKLNLVNSESKTDISLPESVFGKDFNEDLVHQAVVTFLAGARQGVEAVFLLLQYLEITLRRLIRKCIELLFAQYFQSFIDKKE